MTKSVLAKISIPAILASFPYIFLVSVAEGRLLVDPCSCFCLESHFLGYFCSIKVVCCVLYVAFTLQLRLTGKETAATTQTERERERERESRLLVAPLWDEGPFQLSEQSSVSQATALCVEFITFMWLCVMCALSMVVMVCGCMCECGTCQCVIGIISFSVAHFSDAPLQLAYICDSCAKNLSPN